MPEDADARARAINWMFAALNTVEQPIVEREGAVLTERDKAWHEARLPVLDARVRTRLDQLSDSLGDADWLDGGFSAGDLLMVTVLRRLSSTGILDDYPNLSTYIARGETRPAYQRAFADQLAVFRRVGRRLEISPRPRVQNMTAIRARRAMLLVAAPTLCQSFTRSIL